MIDDPPVSQLVALVQVQHASHGYCDKPRSVQKSRPLIGRWQILLVLGFLVVVIVLVWAVYLVYTLTAKAVSLDKAKIKTGPAPCLSQACLKAAAQLSASDPFAQSCDYFLFTCRTQGVVLSRRKQRSEGDSNTESVQQWRGAEKLRGEKQRQDRGRNRQRQVTLSPKQAVRQNEPPKRAVRQNEPPKRAVRQNEPPKRAVRQNEPPKRAVRQNESPKRAVRQNEPPKRAVRQNESPKRAVRQNEPPKRAVRQNEPPKRAVRQNEPPKRAVRQTALLQFIRDILESKDIVESKDSAHHKAQMFYRSCMNKERIEKSGPEPVQKLIEKLGGWPVSGNWDHSDFNETLSVLMKDYYTFPFFNVYVGRDPEENNSTDPKKYMQIDQPDFLIPVEWMSKAQKSITKAQDMRHFVSSRVQLLGHLGVPASSNSRHMGWFFQLSSELALATSPLLYRLQHQLLYQRLSVEELQARAPAVDWLHCLQAALYPRAVSESDTVFVHNLPYITHMSKIISRWQRVQEFSKSGTLHTFMMLSLLHTVTPALSSKFTDVQRNLSVALGNTEEVEPRWSRCVQQTERTFGTVLSNLMSESVGETQAEEVMHAIYGSLKSKLTGHQWTDRHLSLLDKVTSLTPRLSSNNEKHLDKEYSKVQVTENDYFSNYLQSLSIQQKRLNNLFSHVPDLDMLSITPHLAGNEISFPLGMFVPPLFHPSYPRAVNYGALGTLMAKNILQVLMAEIQDLSEIVQMVGECILALCGRVPEAPDGTHLFPFTSAQQREIWIQYTALHSSLQAYKDSLTHDEDTSLSGLYHTHLFLTSFVQVGCKFDPYCEDLPFNPSFLIAALCFNSNLCPQSGTCAFNTTEHFKQC